MNTSRLSKKGSKGKAGFQSRTCGGKDIRDFLEWVHERAGGAEGTNPGRTANKACEHLRAVLSWAWEQDGSKPHRSSPNRGISATWRVATT